MTRMYPADFVRRVSRACDELAKTLPPKQVAYPLGYGPDQHDSHVWCRWRQMRDAEMPDIRDSSYYERPRNRSYAD